MKNKPVIEILETFKYSVNIQNDYLCVDKLNSFIPTYNSVLLLAKYLNAIKDGSSKSFLLSGSYGTGKSFLISVMLAFASGKITAQQIEVLLKKINTCSANEGEEEFKKILAQNKNLVVFPKDIFEDFSQAISMGILDCISENKLKIFLAS